jgi:hypothetical protein
MASAAHSSAWLDAQPQVAADLLLDLRRHVREVAHRPRQLADGHRLPGPPQPLQVAPGLDVPDGRLEAEGGRLGVHAVRARDGEGVAVAEGQRLEGRPQAFLAGQQQVHRVSQLQRGGGVPDVVRGETHVDEA